jgi:CDP-diacylglycerol--serine O-phosphatidyltransferase
MIRKHVPNFITSLNVLCGSMAVVLILNGALTTAVFLIVLAMVFDFLDGMSARMLKAYSPIGKELDSLADVISFGLAPGLLMFKMLEHALALNTTAPGFLSQSSWADLLILGSAFLIPIFSALRLAKFNVDERQTSSFIGLPTPANALFIASLALIKEHGSLPILDNILLGTPVLLGITLLFSWLLVAEIPMFSLKFKNLTWQSNRIQYLFVAGTVILLAAFQLYGIATIIPLFIILSIVTNLVDEYKNGAASTK